MFWLVLFVVLALTGLWVWAVDAHLRRCRAVYVSGVTVALRTIHWLITFVALIGLFWFFVNRFEIGSAPPFLFGALFLGMFLILIPFLGLPWVILEAAWRLVVRIRSATGVQKSSDAPSIPSRRALFGKGAATALGMMPHVFACGGLAGAYVQRDRFRIRSLSANIKGLPLALDGLRIAHLTDSHLGEFTGRAMTGAVVDQLRRIKPDLIVHTGDLINHDLQYLPLALDWLQTLRDIAPLAVVEGNHDLFAGAEPFRRPMRQADVGFLAGEGRLVELRGEPVALLGMPWSRSEEAHQRSWEMTANASESLRQQAVFEIGLIHHPHAFDALAQASVPLVFAGHTHGGQLLVPTTQFPGERMFRYLSGHYRKGQSQLVVSNGIGNWFPLRVGAPAELVYVELKRAHG